MPTSSLARRRRKRWLTGLTAAAASVAAIVGGVSVVTNLLHGDTMTASGTTADRAAAPAEAGPGAGAGTPVPPAASLAGPTLLVSGLNYTTATLGKLSAPRSAADLASGEAFGSPLAGAKESIPHVPEAVRDAAPPPLARLLDPVALTACLDAIRTVKPGSVVTVDYARFANEPALIVVVQQAGKSTVIAAGPECGRAGADEKGSVSVP